MPSVKASPRTPRAEQAARTRARILEAAASVFESQGFSGARIEDVAAEAAVAVPTIYKVFGNKPTLLVEALNHALAGGDDGAIDDQGWFTEQLEEPDPVRQLELIARNARQMYERAAPLLNLLRSAAPLDDDLARAWDDIATQRRARSRRSAKSLLGKAGRHARLKQDELAVTLLALTDPELFTAHVGAKRTAADYETWLADLLRRAALA